MLRALAAMAAAGRAGAPLLSLLTDFVKESDAFRHRHNNVSAIRALSFRVTAAR